MQQWITSLLWSVGAYTNAGWNVSHSVIISQIHLVCEAIFSPNKNEKRPGETEDFSAQNDEMWSVLSDLKNPHQSILILTLHNWADAVSGAGPVTHPSEGPRDGIRPEISCVNEALLHYRAERTRDPGRVPDDSVSAGRGRQIERGD